MKELDCGLSKGKFWKAAGIDRHTCGLIPLDQMPEVPVSIPVPESLYWLLGCPAPLQRRASPLEQVASWLPMEGTGTAEDLAGLLGI